MVFTRLESLGMCGQRTAPLLLEAVVRLAQEATVVTSSSSSSSRPLQLRHDGCFTMRGRGQTAGRLVLPLLSSWQRIALRQC
mmetsp:Transcript_95624/g.252689  ORF Transcript_95624/g.252689 Transcript_95624/m.252689 type:complete len:82 (-) Transcript_95624:174-419(-)